MKTKIFHSFLMSLVLFSGILSANVGGVVFKDTHNYGIKDANESGLSDIKLAVADTNGNEQIVTTDANGNWSSPFTAPVRVQVLDENTDCRITAYGDDSKSNVRLIQNSNSNVNFGLYSHKDSGLGDAAPIEVGNLIWEDKNGDGIQDAGEKGIEGVAVELICDGDSDPVATAITDENGHYIFSSDTSKNSTDSLRYGITELTQNNTNNCKIVIEEQEALCSLDVTKNVNGNEELDNDGVLDGDKVVADIPNDIQAGDNNHNIDIGFNPCQVCIGDFVWNDTNKNGIQDADEKGIKDLFVSLLNEDGSVKYTVQTDSNGKYEFCELYDGEKYKISVLLPNTNYAFSPQNQGSDRAKDSNVDYSGKSGLITIGKESNYTIDAGIYELPPQTHCIGSVYWYDKNLNKVLDSSDIRLSGKKVWLYDENKNLINETVTNDNGEYRFCGLSDGNYYVKFQLPDGYLFLPKNQGNNSSADSDANSNGWSDMITVNGNDVEHIDAGIYCSCSEGEVKNWEKLKASFSGYMLVIFILLLISVTFRDARSKER